jgi:regulation of enolase protein 1 (concanavalin A-like superfamily)
VPAVISDDFHESALNTQLWTFVNPLNDGSYQMTGSNILLNVPAGTAHDLWTGGDNAVRIVQSAANVDFQLEAKFESSVTQQYQTQGILVEQDASNYLRFDVFSDGTSPWIFSATIINGTPTAMISTQIASGAAPFWIRVTRAGNNWTQWWSSDGVNFNNAGTYTQALTVNRVGPYAANSGLMPAFVGSVDYFFNSADPISPEDGGGPGITLINVTPTSSSAIVTWTTDRPTTSLVNYGPTATYGSSTTLDPTLVTSHSATLIGLTCGSTYHYSITSTDGSSNTIVSPDATFVPPCPDAGAPVSDDFTSTTLNTNVWTFVNPVNDGGSYSLNGSSIQLSVPAGNGHDVWTTGDNAVRIMQPVSDADFEVEAKFSSAVNIQTPYQIQGIVVEQDASNFLRFSVHSDNLRQFLFIASISGSSANILVDQEIRGGAATWMRVKRTGNSWALSYSYDSIHWTPATTFSLTLQVARIGPFAGNGQYNGGSAPAFTATVDHFVNRQAAPSTVDGSSYPPTPAPPVINVWYGDSQTFGQNGVPQQWVNVLGDVSSFDQVTTLTYSLNGGAQQTLWMGENLVRLVAPGNFNVEIDYASLQSGNNTVQIVATDAVGRQTVHNVNVYYVAGQTWPATYTANWASTTNIQSLAQIVDGQWQLQPDGTVRIMQTGYDRLIAIGDRTTWQNYVVTAQVTMNWLDPFGFAVGIVVGWQGHTTLQYGVALPDQPRTGHPFPGLGEYSMGNGPPCLNIDENTPSAPENIMVQDTSGRTLQTGVQYIFKFQVQQNSSGGSHYSFKVWPASGTEPASWDLQTDGELSQGSIILAAHRADVSFGVVTITGL